MAEDDAAFYGPKIDIQVTDGADRESTVHVDFHQPDQFNLHCIGSDGAKHRPVVVHLSIIGSVERAVAHLIEQHRGAFAAWLAPPRWWCTRFLTPSCRMQRPSPSGAPISGFAPKPPAGTWP